MTGEVQGPTAGGAASGVAIGAFALGPAGVALALGATLVQGLFSRRAKRKLRRAKALQALNTRLSNIQAKRQFITQAKLARAEVLAAGAAQAGGLDSSGTQGQLASVDTQTENALKEQKIRRIRNKQIGHLTDSAASTVATGQVVTGAINAAGAVATKFGV